jgi:hypothetical protein
MPAGLGLRSSDDDWASGSARGTAFLVGGEYTARAPGFVPVARVQLLITSALLSSFGTASSVVGHFAQPEQAHAFAESSCSSHRAVRGLRNGSFLELVLPNPPVQLCARQSKSPCCLGLVAAAVAQDFDNRGAFDDAQIGGVIAE